MEVLETLQKNWSLPKSAPTKSKLPPEALEALAEQIAAMRLQNKFINLFYQGKITLSSIPKMGKIAKRNMLEEMIDHNKNSMDNLIDKFTSEDFDETQTWLMQFTLKNLKETNEWLKQCIKEM